MGEMLLRLFAHSRGRKVGHKSSVKRGRTPAPRSTADLFTRARPCPRAHSSAGTGLARTSLRAPLLCREGRLMQ